MAWDVADLSHESYWLQSTWQKQRYSAVLPYCRTLNILVLLTFVCPKPPWVTRLAAGCAECLPTHSVMAMEGSKG